MSLQAGTSWPKPRWHWFRWSLVVAATVATAIDFSRIGLISTGGPDMIKWLARLPTWYLPILLVAPRWGPMLEAFRRPPISWMLVWTALGSVSVLWAISPSQAVLVGLGIAGLTLLATWHVYSCGWHSFATAMVFGLTLVVGAGMILDLAEGVLGADRSGGLTTSPTTHARLAAYNCVLSAGLIWSKRYGSYLWVPPIISVAALAYSETRTAMIAAFVGILYGGLRRLTPLYRWVVGIGVVVGTAAVLILVLTLTTATDFEERGDPTSVTGRTSIWPVAVDLILEEPILGYGTGAEEQLFQQAAADGRLTFLAGTSHSMYLSPFLSGGVVGFALLAIAIGSAVRHRSRVDAWIFAPVIAVLISGLTEAIVHIPAVSMLLLAGCLAAISRSPRWTGRVTTYHPDEEVRVPREATPRPTA